MTGRRLVVTLSNGVLDGLDRSLSRLGAEWEHRPLLTFEVSGFESVMADFLPKLRSYAAVALTSPRAAAVYARAVHQAGIASPPVWTTGPGTARELRRLAPVHHVETPNAGGAAAELARLMLVHGVSGTVLFPCGERHRDELPRRLREAGVHVEEVACYRAVVADPQALRAAAASGDVLVVGSASVAAALAAAVAPDNRPGLVALGPSTARGAREAGWEPVAVSDAPTIPSLLQTLHAVLKVFPGAAAG